MKQEGFRENAAFIGYYRRTSLITGHRYIVVGCTDVSSMLTGIALM
ncbi:hypothetical protein [Burkholderia sp. YIM B11467]